MQAIVTQYGLQLFFCRDNPNNWYNDIFNSYIYVYILKFTVPVWKLLCFSFIVNIKYTILRKMNSNNGVMQFSHDESILIKYNMYMIYITKIIKDVMKYQWHYRTRKFVFESYHNRHIKSFKIILICARHVIMKCWCEILSIISRKY